jgi:hypothetical protein
VNGMAPSVNYLQLTTHNAPINLTLIVFYKSFAVSQQAQLHLFFERFIKICRSKAGFIIYKFYLYSFLQNATKQNNP